MLNALELELELELVPKTDPKLERLLKSFSDDLLVELVKLLKLVELNEFVLLELFKVVKYYIYHLNPVYYLTFNHPETLLY